MVGYRAFANCTAVLPDPSPSGFRPRIGVRDRLESSRIEGEEKILPARVPALALTPTLSQRERENWLLSLPVPLAEVGVSLASPPVDSRVRRDHDHQGILADMAGNIHPGSEPGTCFHRNRSCRLVPAHSRYEKPELWFGTAH